jgi:hypothetical protein
VRYYQRNPRVRKPEGPQRIGTSPRPLIMHDRSTEHVLRAYVLDLPPRQGLDVGLPSSRSAEEDAYRALVATDGHRFKGTRLARFDNLDAIGAGMGTFDP